MLGKCSRGAPSVGELQMTASALLILRYEQKHGMPCRFGGKGVEARFLGDIEEWTGDRHLSHVALQDRCCLGWLHIEQIETLSPFSATEASPLSSDHLNGSGIRRR